MRSLVLAALLLAMTTTGCSTPATDVLLFGDECQYRGPDSIEAGPHELSIHLQGLGEYEVELVALDDGSTSQDLADHLSSGDESSNDMPDWARAVASIEVENNTTEASDSVAVGLDAGEFALVCVDHGALSGERIHVFSLSVAES